MRAAIVCMLLWASPAFAEPLKITAKIVEMPKQIVPCGYIAFKAVVRYEVITVDQGTYSKREIFVVELCPEFRTRGELRTLKLRPATRRDSFVDDFKATSGLRWVNIIE